MLFNACKKTRSDEDIEAETGVSREEHENRNQYNEFPTGKVRRTPDDPTIWIDEDKRVWKLNLEPNAAFHQPMPLPIAFIRAILGECIPFMRVPNLKFISKNDDGKYSEFCANRYTGELVIEQKIIGSFNLCTDAPDAMNVGKLPTTGEHDTMDVIPHNEYGHNYKHIAKGIPIGSLDKAPVVLHLDD